MKIEDIINALIEAKLIDNAKIQALDRNYDNMNMLIVISTGRIPTMTETIETMIKLSYD